MKRWIVLLLLLVFVGCNQTPSGTDGGVNDSGNKETVSDLADAGNNDTGSTDKTPDATPDNAVQEDKPDGKPPTCKEDCDCKVWKQGYVCESGVCTPSKRVNACPNCDSDACPAGKTCARSDGTKSVCPGAGTSCKHDCDCLKEGLLCDSSQKKCAALRRKTNCVGCKEDCVAGEPCVKDPKTKEIGVCTTSTGKPCRHDCDCVKEGKVCHEGKCAALKRMSFCVSCTASCKLGDPCLNHDGSIGKCTTQTCKHDCDCHPLGKNCDSGKCTNSRRVSLCVSCDGKCKQGDPCKKPSGGYGTCGSSSTGCKNDCDCKGLGEVCETGQCKASGRDSKCLRCTDIRCKKGDPCKKLDGTVSTCQGTTCCNVVGCSAGRVCCPMGAKPPPGVCGFTCDPPGPNGQCIPKP